MRSRQSIILSIAVLLWCEVLQASPQGRSDLPRHALPEGAIADALVIGNCDGRTSVKVPGKKAGDKLTRTEAVAATRELMDEWKKKNPGKNWSMPGTTVANQRQSASANRKDIKNPETQKGVYSDFTPEDEKLWELEQNKLIQQGKEIFHSAERLKSQTAISCDMCHPDGSNTHPQTYPKYQVQLQRVALLRDMINWCIENPVKGVMLADEAPALRALEAYIISQHRGLKLTPGKH